jgi:hypothetical protein
VPFLANFSQIPSLSAWLASIQSANASLEGKARTGCSVAIGRPIVHSTAMPKRLIAALVAALALVVAAPAFAQDPTATASPGQPPANASAAVKKIYSDYRDDGTVAVCKHARADLQKALDTIEKQFDIDYPDFRDELKAGIQEHDKGRCPDDSPTPAPTAMATAAPAPSVTAAPSTESGTLPPSTGGGKGGGGGATPPESGALPPTDSPTPGATVAPPPVATATVAPPAPTPVASATPAIVTRSGTDRLLIPGILVGLALLGAAALALSAVFARRNPTWDHAWREAGMRVRGTWADFSDWLRLGR